MNSFLVQLKGTTAFFIQATISFAVAVIATGAGIAYLPAPIWIRAFLGLGLLYVITSTFTLAKVVRDRQEADVLMQRPEAPRPGLPPNAPYVDSSAGAWG